MTLPDTINILPGTAIVWSDTTDYSSTATGLARTHQIDLTGVAATEAREGAKADFGAAFARQHLVYVGIEMDVAATPGELIEIWWAGSPHATAGNANPGGTTGADADYAGGADSLANAKLQLQYLGSLIATVEIATVVQYQTMPEYFVPKLRYGFPVVVNLTGQAFEGDAVEMLVALIPYTDQVVD